MTCGEENSRLIGPLQQMLNIFQSRGGTIETLLQNRVNLSLGHITYNFITASIINVREEALLGEKAVQFGRKKLEAKLGKF